MTIQQIKYALTVARAGSMNKAAKELFITQSTLSSAIKELEDEAGVTIFLRTGKGASVTPDGAEFLTCAGRVYEQYELLRVKYGKGADIKRKFAVSSQHYSFAVKAFAETVRRFDTLRFDFAIRETKTLDVIKDVGGMRSEIGILFRSAFNSKVIDKLLAENDLEFTPLINCRAYVYLWRNHPLANEPSISLGQLKEYPCMCFEQGDGAAAYFAEEILSDIEYPRIIRSTDRATQLDLMVLLNGYTLCSGIICEELNGSLYKAVPFCEDGENLNPNMEIGYIAKRSGRLSEFGEVFLEEVRGYLQSVNAAPL